jgi:molecular chaperone GrpE
MTNDDDIFLEDDELDGDETDEDGDGDGDEGGTVGDVGTSATDALRDTLRALGEQLAQAQEEVAAANERTLRKAADLENARRRHQREKDDLVKYAAESVLKDVVPVLDDLQRAVQHLGTVAGVETSLVQGLEMVVRKFEQTLQRRGVVIVESVGKPFDPQVHEAIQQVHDESVPHNTVVQEFQRGCLLHDRLLRPALVVVAQGGPARDESVEMSGDAEAAPSGDTGETPSTPVDASEVAASGDSGEDQ